MKLYRSAVNSSKSIQPYTYRRKKLVPFTFFSLLIISPIFFTPTSQASEEEQYNLPPSSSIYISGGTDSNRNKYTQIQLNIELKEYQQINMGYGESNSDTASLNMSQYFISIGTNPYKDFSINTSYSLWGKTNSLETRNFKSDLNLNTLNWSFSLSPQLNVVTFYGLNNTQKFDLYAKAIAISTSYFGIEDYFFNLSYYLNKYADDPFFLKNRTLTAVSAIISETAQLLMSGLEKNNSSISVGRFFNWGNNSGSISLDLSRSSASFSNIITNTASLYGDYSLTNNISLNLSASIQTSNYDNTTLTAADFGMSYIW